MKLFPVAAALEMPDINPDLISNPSTTSYFNSVSSSIISIYQKIQLRLKAADDDLILVCNQQLHFRQNWSHSSCLFYFIILVREQITKVLFIDQKLNFLNHSRNYKDLIRKKYWKWTKCHSRRHKNGGSLRLRDMTTKIYN